MNLTSLIKLANELDAKATKEIGHPRKTTISAGKGHMSEYMCVTVEQEWSTNHLPTSYTGFAKTFDRLAVKLKEKHRIIDDMHRIIDRGARR